MPDTRAYGLKLFADGADLEQILRLAQEPHIDGFTTNPTIMRQAGVEDYEGFCRKVLDHVTDLPVSLEVLADTTHDMARQAALLASWGSNVYVKIPVTYGDGSTTEALVRHLTAEGIQLNVTALMALPQVERMVGALAGAPSGIVSVFAGRIADTGRDPVPLMAAALELLRAEPGLELLWASPREVLNVRQAADVGCHIITVTTDLLAKLRLFGKDLEEFSLETVRMFLGDVAAAGYLL